MSNDFSFFRLRFSFQAKERLYLAGMAANTMRGAFGYALRETAGDEFGAIFAPGASGPHPSGLADLPRPFVFRCAHLDGATIEPGQGFWFDVNLFDTSRPLTKSFADAFRLMGRRGVGVGRGRAELRAADEEAVAVSLTPGGTPVECLFVDFLTPTELKSQEQITPEPAFSILFARVRDRISTLRTLYGPGPPDADFRAMGERARAVRTTACDIRFTDATRHSSRTGQRHPIGGFVGTARYEGLLTEFLPWLQAARYTGVGRQTTWGKGEVRVRDCLEASAFDTV